MPKGGARDYRMKVLLKKVFSGASSADATRGVSSSLVQWVRLRFKRAVRALGLLSAIAPQLVLTGARSLAFEHDTGAVVYSQSLDAGGATLQIDFAAGALDLPKATIIDRIRTAAETVAFYYGHFPVPRVRILIVPVAGRRGVLQGTTWGDRDGFPAFLRIRVGELTTPGELAQDWVVTHEMVHTAMVSLPDHQLWLEEGLATYIEPIARVQAGELTAASIWADMMRGMPNGEPGLEDRGLNRTPTWGRTYWGGALFCLMADIQIRRQTANRHGLQDALRAIVAAGGTIDKEWPLLRVLRIGDQATGTNVLAQMYAHWSEAPVQVDLPALWKQLGVRAEGNTVTFDAEAPLASVRAGITESHKLKSLTKSKDRYEQVNQEISIYPVKDFVTYRRLERSNTQLQRRSRLTCSSAIYFMANYVPLYTRDLLRK
jgi:hypothetical protein